MQQNVLPQIIHLIRLVISYLTDDEVEVIFDEDFYLLAKLVLHGSLALAAQVRRSLTDAAGYQGVTLTRHFFRNTARGLVYCLPLYTIINNLVLSSAW